MTAKSSVQASRRSRAAQGPFGPCVTAGVDYITLTCKSVDGYDRLSEIAARLLRTELDQGERLSSWRFMNFDGRTAGSVQAGTDGATFLLRLSGVTAFHHWQEVLPLATNVSRLDLQSTVQLEIDGTNFAEQCESQALRFEAKHKHGRQIELRRNSAKGKTVYIGSPQSDRQIRIYDKGRESGLPAYNKCWRAEIQFGSKLAWSMSQQLHEWTWQDIFAAKVVFESCARAGIVWKQLLAKEVLLSGPARPRRRLETKLTWLTNQVRPTILQLLDHYPRSVVMDALGLGDGPDRGDKTK